MIPRQDEFQEAKDFFLGCVFGVLFTLLFCVGIFLVMFDKLG